MWFVAYVNPNHNKICQFICVTGILIMVSLDKTSLKRVHLKMKLLLVIISAVKRLITSKINVCVYIIHVCVYCLYSLCIYKYTHKYIFNKNMLRLYI